MLLSRRGSDTCQLASNGTRHLIRHFILEACHLSRQNISGRSRWRRCTSAHLELRHYPFRGQRFPDEEFTRPVSPRRPTMPPTSKFSLVRMPQVGFASQRPSRRHLRISGASPATAGGNSVHSRFVSLSPLVSYLSADTQAFGEPHRPRRVSSPSASLIALGEPHRPRPHRKGAHTSPIISTSLVASFPSPRARPGAG